MAAFQKGDRVVVTVISAISGRLVRRDLGAVERVTKANRVYVRRDRGLKNVFITRDGGTVWRDLEETRRGRFPQYRTTLERAP